jgi:hypothetical protein
MRDKQPKSYYCFHIRGTEFMGIVKYSKLLEVSSYPKTTVTLGLHKKFREVGFLGVMKTSCARDSRITLSKRRKCVF